MSEDIYYAHHPMIVGFCMEYFAGQAVVDPTRRSPDYPEGEPVLFDYVNEQGYTLKAYGFKGAQEVKAALEKDYWPTDLPSIDDEMRKFLKRVTPKRT
jgi:hypothetical protein